MNVIYKVKNHWGADSAPLQKLQQKVLIATKQSNRMQNIKK
jgi:hypothetical protein